MSSLAFFAHYEGCRKKKESIVTIIFQMCRKDRILILNAIKGLERISNLGENNGKENEFSLGKVESGTLP